MSASTARQWERVEYQAPIQLRVSSDEVEPRTLHARAVNLSEGGIQVRTDKPLPIGEAVTCSMLLEGRPAALRGKVRWARAEDVGFDEPGAGIQFDGLSDDHSSLLRHLVTKATRGNQPVELFLPGMAEAIHARAFTTDGGLQITAALPILARESPIEFRFHDAGPRFKGRIAQVSVRERGRTPHLEVELAVHAREAARFRHYTLYEVPDLSVPDLDTRVQPPREVPRPARRAQATPLPELPKSLAARLPRVAIVSSVGIGATLLVMLVAWIVAAPSTATRTPPAASAAPRSAPVPIPVVVAPAPDAPRAIIEPPPAADAPRPAPAPVIHTEDDATEALIPISGTLAGMRVVRWVSPIAVVIELPNASLTAPAGKYFPKTGDITQLALAQLSQGARIRAFLNTAPAHHEVALRDGQLVLRVAP